MPTTPDFFRVARVNPNDTRGGGGCLATGARAGEDCKGRWVEFFRVSTEHDASPHAVICEFHLAEVWHGIDFAEESTEGDPLPLRQPVEWANDPVRPLVPAGE